MVFNCERGGNRILFILSEGGARIFFSFAKGTSFFTAVKGGGTRKK